LKYFYLWAEKFTAGFKDKIICVSEYDRQLALKYKIAPADKLVTIHNGISPINFYSREEAQKIINSKIQKNKLSTCRPGFDPRSKIQGHEQVFRLRVKPAMTNNFLIGSIGNLYKTKGYEYFIQTADLLVNHHLAATFIVIGEGEERKMLENLIAKYNLKNNFILIGRIDDAAKLLPALDVYICFSVKEGFPYSVIEAMQAGLPIVSTAVGGIPEIIENEKTGLLVEPADAKTLAEKIKTFLDNKNLAENFGQNAKAKAETEFVLEKMVYETKKFYN